MDKIEDLRSGETLATTLPRGTLVLAWWEEDLYSDGEGIMSFYKDDMMPAFANEFYSDFRVMLDAMKKIAAIYKWHVVEDDETAKEKTR